MQNHRLHISFVKKTNRGRDGIQVKKKKILKYNVVS